MIKYIYQVIRVSKYTLETYEEWRKLWRLTKELLEEIPEVRDVL